MKNKNKKTVYVSSLMTIGAGVIILSFTMINGYSKPLLIIRSLIGIALIAIGLRRSIKAFNNIN